MSTGDNRRILVIDDNPAIHEDFNKILGNTAGTSEAATLAKEAFFGGAHREAPDPYEIDSAFQGAEAVEKVNRALDAQQNYAMAFVDVRMPPGLDGVETIERLWKIDPDLQCVICTAFADYSWQGMIDKLGTTDRLLILKKPFDPIEVRQLATALTEKWNSTRRERARLREVKRAEQEARVYAVSLMTVNRALETAKGGAEALARFRSEFLVGVTQEIRTPATIIVGGAEALQNPGLNEESRSAEVNSIQENGARLISILDDIQDLALIELGTMDLQRKACSPSRIIDEVLQNLRPTIDEKGLTVTRRSIRPIPELIDSDPARLRRMLESLIGAVVHLDGADSVTVTMEMERVEEWQEPQLEITIVGGGVLLSSEQQGRMFEALAEDGSTGTTRCAASRLGLALAKRLARLLGGDVSVESRPNIGTCFTLSVKTGDLSDVHMLADVHMPADVHMLTEPRGALPGPSPRRDARQPSATSLEGRVLVVEDNQTTQHLFRHLLVNAGAEVSLAENGEVGRDLTLGAARVDRPFALVLMDMQMPKMDGYQATRELRAVGYKGPIVAVTAHCMQGDREKCRDAGCDDLIPKPVERESFIAVCRKWMKKDEPEALLPAPKEVDGQVVDAPTMESTDPEKR